MEIWKEKREELLERKDEPVKEEDHPVPLP